MLVHLLRDLYGDYGLCRACTAIDLPPNQARRLIARGLAVAADTQASPQQQAFASAPQKKSTSGVAKQSMPLVSCIMPTSDRAKFIPGAIQNFLRQTYQPSELLVIDDGSESIEHLVPSLPHIRYLRMQSRLPLGGKRNYGVACAAGEVIAHWDDDDRYSPDRIATQVSELLQNPDVVIVGYRDIDFITTRGVYWRMIGDPGYIAGTSMMYWRSWAVAHPFPVQTVGEDNAFLARCNGRVKILAGNGAVICRIHADNTVKKRPGGRGWQRIEKGHIPVWAEL